MTDKPSATILVIAEDYVFRQDVALLLQFEDFATLEAATTEGGLELARSSHPDLIVCSNTPPAVDALRLIQALRADPATQKLPIVTITPKAHGEAYKNAQALGFNEFLTAPFMPDDLLNMVKARLANR
ncbi:MAG: response regulator [Anaerolineae bacterium]|nr:response regulator [Anaerolineae bacterium]